MRSDDAGRNSELSGSSELSRRREVPAQVVSSPAEVPQRTYITGISVSVAGIFSFFVALVSAYIVRRGSPAEDWRALAVPHVLWLNTAILVASSLTLWHSRQRFVAEDESGFIHWWTVTGILGGFFLAGQLTAWRQLSSAAIHLATNPHASFFYLLTAAHGLFLLSGIAALLFVATKGSRWRTRDTAGRALSIYWHFMTCTWICLFLLFLFGQ